MASPRTYREDRLKPIFHKCVCELYSASVDRDGNKGDFEKVVKDMRVDKRGYKYIPIYDYYIPSNVKEQIMLKYKRLVPSDKDWKWVSENAEAYCPTTIIKLWRTKDERQ